MMGNNFDNTYNLYLEEFVKSRKLRGSTGLTRKRQNLLADYDRANPNYPQQLERLKKLQTGKFQISNNTLKQILNIYNITDLSKTKSRKLGNTGITLSIENGNYYISK